MIEGFDPFYNGEWDQTLVHNPYEAEGYRLPTEAEWEYASEYEDERIYPWGNESPVPCVHANYDYCIGWTAPVGSYPAGASQLGMMDMAGNLYEWVGDWQENYYSPPPIDPLGGNGDVFRKLRSNPWSSSTLDNSWYTESPEVCDPHFGFRIARISE